MEKADWVCYGAAPLAAPSATSRSMHASRRGCCHLSLASAHWPRSHPQVHPGRGPVSSTMDEVLGSRAMGLLDAAQRGL